MLLNTRVSSGGLSACDEKSSLKSSLLSLRAAGYTHFGGSPSRRMSLVTLMSFLVSAT